MPTPPKNTTNSVASCSPELHLDFARYRQFDQPIDTICKLRTIILVAWGGLCAIGIGLVALQLWVLTAVCAIVLAILVLASWKPVKVAALIKTSLTQLYYHGLVTPAIVVAAKDGEVSLLCIANMSAVPGVDAYASKLITVPSIAPQADDIGKRVPMVSVFQPGGAKHQDFEPRPIAWGTKKVLEIERNLAKIEADEWDLIERAKAQRLYTADGELTELD